MSTADYIRKIWDDEPVSCVVHMCSAHVMHKITTKTKHFSKKLKKFLLRFCAKMVESKKLKTLGELFTLMCQMCLSKQPPAEDLLDQVQAAGINGILKAVCHIRTCL